MIVYDRNSRIEVRVLSNGDALWPQINSSNLFSIYYLKDWKNIIEDVFKHTGIYITASKDGMLIDLLPFFLVKHFILGKKLISTPYEGCNGGFSSSHVEVKKKLIDKILEHARTLDVKYVEIRSKYRIEELVEFGFIEKSPLLVSEIPLKNVDVNWKMLSPSHRRNTRIACKKGIKIKQATNVTEMKIFYKILARHYQQIGVPFFGEKFFIQIWHQLIQNNYGHLLLAKLDEKIIGGLLLFFNGKTLIAKYSACKKNEEYKKLNASYALFWEGIQLGLKMNFKNFNLGVTGSFHSGLLDFKSRFGAQNSPLYFYYYLISGRIPDLSKYYSQFSLLKKMWSLTPRFLTSLIGQKINAWIC